MGKEEDLKQELFNTKIQLIEINAKGIILNSDDTIFQATQSSSVSDLDPFFEGILPLVSKTDDRISIPCINIAPNGFNFIVDVILETSKGKHYLLIFDFTEHYQSSHTLTQEKNEASIEKHKLAFTRDLLSAKEQFKNNFIANLNHEIRNPLNNLLGFMEILKGTKLNYEQQETLNVMRRTGIQLKVLMEDLLDISKIERGILDIKHIPFNLKTFLKDLQKHFTARYSESEIIFDLNIEKNVPTKLLGDPTRLYQIFFNLIENAYKNVAQGKFSITVSAVSDKEKDTTDINFEVSDTGKGLSQEDISDVFTEYHQLHLNQLKPIGKGLGLKIVKEFVQLLGGSISMKSSEENGTTFSIKLPFDVRKETPKRKTIPKGTGIIKSIRLLVVEDQELNQLLYIKTFLNNDKGYFIDIAKSGDHAFEIFEKRNYRAVILKSNYPDASAREIIKKIRSNDDDAINLLPILVVSGKTMPEQQKELLDAGASGFLTKPHTKKELFKNIEKLL